MRTIFAIMLFFAPQLQGLELMLYYASTCPYSRKVLNYLNSIEKTVPMKDVSRNAEAKREFLELGDIKVVPCLTIDGTPLYDAYDIIDWLSSHQENLLPKKDS